MGMQDTDKFTVLNTEQSDIQAAIEAGKNIAQVLPPVDGYKATIFAPKTGEIRLLERDKLSKPRFLTASPIFNDAAGFIAYLNDFKDPATRLFYRLDGTVVAVIDYHIQRNVEIAASTHSHPDQRHGDHVAVLKLVRSPEWTVWQESNEKPFGQQAFAEFLEDNLADIIKPDPSEIVTVARDLTVTTGATLRRANNMATGEVQFQYDETVNGIVKSSQAAVPTDFDIGIRPFMGTERFPVNCKLRYRTNGADLKLHYKALHLDRITEASIDLIIAKIASETGISPAHGSHDRSEFKRGE